VVHMKVRGVALDQQMNPVVLLVDQAETMALPIWIGQAEATAIAMQLQGAEVAVGKRDANRRHRR